MSLHELLTCLKNVKYIIKSKYDSCIRMYIFELKNQFSYLLKLQIKTSTLKKDFFIFPFFNQTNFFFLDFISMALK